MAIGALLGEKHWAMHDYESFFWVLFWICIHYDGSNAKGKAVRRFEKWNFMDPEELAGIKLGIVADEEIFLETFKQYLTLYYNPLRPWINRLRRVVFPNGRLRKEEDEGLASKMMLILAEAQGDPDVLANPDTSDFSN